MAGKEAFCMSNPLQPESSPDAIRTSTSLRTLSLNDETKSLSDQGCCSTSTTSDDNSSFPDVSLPSSSWRTLSLDEQLLRGRGRASSSQRPSSHEHCCRRVSSCQTISGNLALDPMITCKLCLCECKLHEMHQMHRCSCIYCKKCLEQYLVVLTEEGAVSIVTCPDAACKEHGRIADEEIQLLVDDAFFERFKKVKFMKEVELDPGRAWCPRVGCNTVCRQTEKEKKQEDERQKVKGKKLIRINGKKFNCSKCGLTFCSICKAPWHGGRPCSKLSRGGTGSTSGKSRGTSHILDMLGIQKDDSDEVSIKRCPFCHIPIERDAGCAQMMCKNCQHVFCWYCLANLDNDFLLRHYDKGPCKNKLGHSRTTVIFHRAQIVCVFAGFGFLLLIASPFLLLVAPCILCCKSKWGNMCDDIDEIPES